MENLRYRLPARRVNIRKRFAALTTNERLRAKFFRRVAFVLLAKSRLTDNEDDTNKFKMQSRVCFLRYASIVMETEHFTIERPLRIHNLDFEMFSRSACWNYFEFRQEDLTRLLAGLQFPESCRLENNSRMSGKEVLMRGLYELVSGSPQFTTCEAVFGRDQSQQSRAFKFFVNHIYENFLFLVTNNLQWWHDNGFFEESNAAIQSKLEELNLQFDEVNQCDIGFFIDCNCMESSRVGGGPREDGPDAERWVDEIQRAFYNGWKSVHGLKHQTVDLAHGYTIDIFGPTSLRRSDLHLLGESEINAKLAQVQQGNPKQLKAFGDSIYPNDSHVDSYHKGANLTERQSRENGKKKRVRVAIEWNYGVTANLFRYLKNIQKLKVMNGGTVAKIYTVATILRNCHVMLYGGISSSYFDIRIPDDMLERYLGVI